MLLSSFDRRMDAASISCDQTITLTSCSYRPPGRSLTFYRQLHIRGYPSLPRTNHDLAPNLKNFTHSWIRMQYLKGSRRRRSQKTQCYLAAGPASGDWRAGNERTGAYFDATSIGVTLPGPDRVLSSTPLRPYRAFHKSFTKLRTPQITIIPCRRVLLYMLRNVTSLSVPVSTWLCKTTSWHRQRPRLTFDTATSTFSSEISSLYQ